MLRHMATQLKLRHGKWYARLTLSRPLRKALGRSEVLKSLGTRDLREANKLKHRALALMQQEASRAALAAELHPSSVEHLAEVARIQRAAVVAGLDEHAAEVDMDAAVERWLERMAAKHGTGHDGHPLLPETKERAVRLAHRVFKGEQPDLLSEYVTKHLKELGGRITQSALVTKQRHLTDFSTWAGADAELSTITRRLTARYVMEVIQPGTQATKTKTDHLANLSAFGSWLERYGFCESNPWRGLARTIKESTRGDASRRMRPYTVDEVQQLLTRLPAGPMRDTTLLALFTGMRLEEICQLRVEDVRDGALHVRAGKSANAVRAVPIAPTIGALIAHLTATSGDTYLIAGCRPTGADKKRSATMSARFSAWLRRNGWKGDSSVTFHSTRRTVATRLEAAGIPQHLAAKLLGHARTGMSYGLYSGGPDWAQLVAAVAAIEYGAVVANLINAPPTPARR